MKIFCASFLYLAYEPKGILMKIITSSLGQNRTLYVAENAAILNSISMSSAGRVLFHGELGVLTEQKASEWLKTLPEGGYQNYRTTGPATFATAKEAVASIVESSIRSILGNSTVLKVAETIILVIAEPAKRTLKKRQHFR